MGGPKIEKKKEYWEKAKLKARQKENLHKDSTKKVDKSDANKEQNSTNAKKCRRNMNGIMIWKEKREDLLKNNLRM